MTDHAVIGNANRRSQLLGDQQTDFARAAEPVVEMHQRRVGQSGGQFPRTGVPWRPRPAGPGQHAFHDAGAQRPAFRPGTARQQLNGEIAL